MDAALSLGDLLPTAVAVALSPVPIIAVILMLFSSKARVNGPLFIVGWVAGLTVVGGLMLLFGGDSAGTTSDPSVASLWIKAALGALLLVVGAKQWRDRPGSDDEPSVPEWMAAIDAFTAGKSFGVGVLLSGLNPKNLALTVAGALVILQGGLEPAGEWIALAIFVFLASLTVVVPVAYYLIAGDRAAATLDSMKTWLSRNNTAVMAVLLVVFGVKFVADGLQGLLG